VLDNATTSPLAGAKPLSHTVILVDWPPVTVPGESDRLNIDAGLTVTATDFVTPPNVALTVTAVFSLTVAK
jgi:hypothetical protein